MNKRLTIVLFLFSVFCFCSYAIDNGRVVVYASKERVIKDVYTLASDSMQGRKFSGPGREKAASYIAGQFQKAGLKGINDNEEPYFQKIPVRNIDRGKTIIYKNDFEYISGESFSFASTEALDDSLSIPVKFVGYSTGEMVGCTGEDTLVFFLAHDLTDAHFRLKDLAGATGAKYFGFSIFGEKREVSNFISNEQSLSLDRYPVNSFGYFRTDRSDNWLFDYLPYTGKDIGLFLFDEKLFSKQFGQQLRTKHRLSEKSFRNGVLPYSVETTLSFMTTFQLIEITTFDDNVIGYIEGTDLRDEFVIICGHYDHLGKRGDKIFYGADDNASGTAAVMELARMFMQARNSGMDFRRSIVFIAFGAEESGLNGSLYYVENPVFPVENTVLVINLDMIGRSDQPEEVPGYGFVLPMQGLRRPVWRAFRNTGRQIDDIRLERMLPSIRTIMSYLGSDHYSFIRKGVPAAYVNTGMHPDYHRPSDTPDKINYDNLVNIIKVVFTIAAKVANEPERFPLE